ncbi:acyl-CoA dehydrogenase/oxidase C-terminal [Endogone sp. FLAS-F59071]|nr:acyl-CoA dehydrogenase/oxidase C-terminal [Endogone sp. FLAS-F59071]|eukprot:RUS23104.1 acyl-CoA dehydrogenase/oxidase C-terminal [Endogone sp. FLAS-F59071]
MSLTPHVDVTMLEALAMSRDSCQAQAIRHILKTFIDDYLSLLLSLALELSELEADLSREPGFRTSRVVGEESRSIMVLIKHRFSKIKPQHNLNSATRALLKNLCDLHSLFVIEQNLGEILESGYLDSAQAHLVRQGLRQLLNHLRPHGFGWPDNFLNSALGSYDRGTTEFRGGEVGMDENGVWGMEDALHI